MTTRDLTLIATFAALTAGLGLVPAVPVPGLPVPVTAQTLGVMLAGGCLGPIRGAAAMGLVIVIVALGFPVLAGGRGGLGVFFGPSAGFLIAWPAGAFLIGRLYGPDPRSWWSGALAVAGGGIFIIYAVGIPWMAVAGQLNIFEAAALSAVFLPGDTIKAAAAAWIIAHVKRARPDLAGRPAP